MALPSPPAISGGTWRPAILDDAVMISDLQQACFEADGGYRISPEEFYNALDNPDNNLDDDSLLAVDESGRAIAFVFTQIPSSFENRLRAFCWNFVRPDRRNQGLEDFLLDWHEARSRDRVAGLALATPGLVWKKAYDWQQSDIDRLLAHGYEPMRYFLEMKRDLAGPVSLPVVADGYSLDPWPDDSDGIRLLHNEAFRDHWGAEPLSSDQWQRYILDEFFRQDLSFVVSACDEPVAYLHSAVYPHDFVDRGRSEGWVETLGTAREHRKRGLATVLLQRALAAFQADGLEYGVIAVDADSPTGAAKLYESQGFEVDKRSISFGKLLT
jgi:ribosomal protein S18 acetylase RimI-like enzyme